MSQNTPSEAVDTTSITRALAAPFGDSEVKFKPQAVKGNRALALAYVDVRAIMDRLDNVLGVENWQDDYQLLPDNSVMCRLRLRIGRRWITKMDVGGPSEQPDGGDRLKAAFSDALKRAAVKFGIGRYLYRLPQQWADYDPVKRQFSAPPRLPDWATAKRPARSAAPAAPRASTTDNKPGLPADGVEMHRRLREADADLAARGRCQIGDLLAHVTQAGVKAGFGADLTQWAGPAIELAVAETRAFKSLLPAAPEAKTAA
ncbi:MAG TPA: Rad52/Rad22 family DNA repair protein [Gemmataceae bacterium]|nr:Rad52/Rad22 family DNA repair protein [Gemmataceae bacterium]